MKASRFSGRDALETACFIRGQRGKGACMTAVQTMTFRALLVISVLTVAGGGQVRQDPSVMSSSQSRTPSSLPPLDRSDSIAPDPISTRLQEQQIRSRNSDRQKRLVADTDKLVTLVKELKEQVETPEKPLQPNDVGKRAEEIEKLAKSVKDRMKG